MNFICEGGVSPLPTILILGYFYIHVLSLNYDNEASCYDLKLELRLYLGKGLREVKGDISSSKA